MNSKLEKLGMSTEDKIIMVFKEILSGEESRSKFNDFFELICMN